MVQCPKILVSHGQSFSFEPTTLSSIALLECTPGLLAPAASVGGHSTATCLSRLRVVIVTDFSVRFIEISFSIYFGIGWCIMHIQTHSDSFPKHPYRHSLKKTFTYQYILPDLHIFTWPCHRCWRVGYQIGKWKLNTSYWGGGTLKKKV